MFSKIYLRLIICCVFVLQVITKEILETMVSEKDMDHSPYMSCWELPLEIHSECFYCFSQVIWPKSDKEYKVLLD